MFPISFEGLLIVSMLLAVLYLVRIFSRALPFVPGAMMALSADRLTDTKEIGLKSYPVAASTIIYEGSLVAINTDGYAVPAADTSGFKVVGVADEQVDNSSGSAADLAIRVKAPIRAKFAATSITQAMVGEPMYVVDDQTFDDTPGTNGILAGVLDEYVSATEGWLMVASIVKAALTDVTASAAELNVLDGVVAGTVTASKGVVVGANKEIDTLALPVGGLRIGAGAGTALTPSAAEINKLNAALMDATIVVGAEAGDARAITIQLKDADGTDLAHRAAVLIAVLADANGDAFVTTGGSTGIAIGTDGALLAIVAKKLFQAISEADGDIDLTWTDTGTEAAYLAVILPNGKIIISDALTNA